MARGSMKDFMMGKRLERIVESYSFPLGSCICGENYEIEDVLLEAARCLKEGLTDARKRPHIKKEDKIGHYIPKRKGD